MNLEVAVGEEGRRKRMKRTFQVFISERFTPISRTKGTMLVVKSGR